jgi:hypothetical protein
MSEIAPVLLGLVDDAACASEVVRPTRETLREHEEARRSPGAGLLGAYVVSDQRWAELGRHLDPERPWPVCVVNTSGAGGLLACASRSVPGTTLAALDSALRDLDDLAGNAARVAAAATGLGEGVEVYVEIPDAPGWERAVAVVEAAGLYAAVRLGAEPARVVRQLSELVEADLPFRTTGWPPPGAGRSLLNLLAAVSTLVEGGSEAAATEQLAARDLGPSAQLVAGWDAADGARVRRRLRRVGHPAPRALGVELAGTGLVSES